MNSSNGGHVFPVPPDEQEPHHFAGMLEQAPAALIPTLIFDFK
jgi:hypothetical protein